MSDRRYLLLVNDAIKTHLAGLPADRRRQLREKLEFLENGIWDSGVRVKKLRGTPRVVFEARLNRADRLLFTLGRHDEATAIYLWAVVEHDDISAGARRIQPSNAPFLAFEELEHEDRQDLALDGLAPAYFTQESVEEKVPDDYGPQRWLVFDDEEWGRLLASTDPLSFEVYLHLTREQEEVLAAPPPVLLSGTAGSGKTTLSVYYLLRGARHDGRRLFITYNPLLRNMAERIYRGLVEKRVEAPGATPPRFALFREIALESAGGAAAGFPPEKEVGFREFTGMLRDHPDRARIDPALAWEEIRSIIKGATVPVDPVRCAVLVERVAGGSASTAERRKLVDYLAGLRNFAIGRKAEASLEKRSLFKSWEELLSAVVLPSERAPQSLAPALHTVADLVTRHPAEFSGPLLSLEDYRAVGRKRAPNFRYDRDAVYAVAQFYQERLQRSGRWDEIDLSRAALRKAGPGAWDLLVCDEIQDLADVQISLLFRLAADPRAVVLTGDPRQIINPTGFRWEEVKYRFRERGISAPEIRRLRLNFRCAGPVVRLGNALLDLKASLVGLSDSEMREEWKFGGRPPLILEGASEEDLLARLRARGGMQVILTRDVPEAERLRTALGTELVFTIFEAKGLEFDTVLLWRFAEDPGAEAAWRDIVSGDVADEARLPHLRHELALLYVAVTRSRNTLLAWDGETCAPVWTAPGISALVFRTDDLDRLTELWKAASSPADWEKEGDYYFERERFAAARECFRNAGTPEKMDRAHARALFSEGDYRQAAPPLLERAGETALAADCWEQTGEWARAEQAWLKVGEARRVRICSAHLCEARGALEAAAQAWEALGEQARADGLWKRAGAFDRLARSAFAARRFSEAAELFERARLGRDAAAAWEKAKQYERAGDLWLRLGEHAEACRLFHKSGSKEKELRCLRHLGRYMEAGVLLEKLGETEKAIEAFSQAAAESKEARGLMISEIKEGTTRRTALKAAVRLAAVGRDGEAAALFLKARAFDAAARRYERVGDHAGVARCHEQAGRWLEAARELGMAPGSDEVRRCDAIQQLLYRHIKAARREGREERELQALVREAGRLREEGNLVAALARFRLCGLMEDVAEVSRALGWHGAAVEWMLAVDNPTEALAFVRKGGFAISAEFLHKLIKANRARPYRSVDSLQKTRATMHELLSTLVETLPAEEATSAVESFFEETWGERSFLDHIPDQGLALLLRHRASAAIMALLGYELWFLRDLPRRLQEFAQRLGKEAQDTGDDGLLACHAFYEDVSTNGHVTDRFERAAARLALTPRTAGIVGRSRLRYREAVDLLMAAGQVGKAERFCSLNRDPGLAAVFAEQRKDFPSAVRWFHDARDLEGAMRCAQASGNQKTVARVHEWRGEVEEALGIWKRLKQTGQVARVLKKYPLLKG